MEITITEALAEIKVIDKRLDSKRLFVQEYLIRPAERKDPLLKDGGSESEIEKTRQSISDLEVRKLAIRRAIHDANNGNSATVGTKTRTIAEWIIWKREIYPGQRDFLGTMIRAISANKKQALQKGVKLTSESEAGEQDVIVNVNESELALQYEELQAAFETLDGQLSLRNATVLINI